MYPSFGSEVERLNEIIVVLLKLEKKSRQNGKYRKISAKIYQTLTTLVLYFYDLSRTNEDIKSLFDFFINQLLNDLKDSNSLFYKISLHCLQEIADCYPEMIESIQKNLDQAQPRNLQEASCLLKVMDLQKSPEIRNLLQQKLVFESDIQFYHYCVYLFQLIQSNRYHKDLLSPLIFRPFISKLFQSNQIFQIHLALQLLLEFGFDIFNSSEEECFMQQLVRICTIPSLPIGYRLLLLLFIKVSFEKIYEPSLNLMPPYLLQSLYPTIFDGPNSIEKKLSILNQSSFVINDEEFFELLTQFQKRCSSEFRYFERSTNSWFHIAVQTIQKHFRDIRQNLINSFIAKLLMSTKDSDGRIRSIESPTIINHRNYSLYLYFINWFLSVAHQFIKLTEFQLEFLINFIHRNSLYQTDSSMQALQCSTSILYYQRVTPKVKEALLELLEWIHDERKSDFEASSLAQIYLLALRTLTEESIKKVFTSDQEEFLLHQTPGVFERYLTSIQNSLSKCPIVITRLQSELMTEEKQFYSDKMTKYLIFKVSLDPKKSKMKQFFCIEIEFCSKSIGFCEKFYFAFLDSDRDLDLKLNFEKIDDSFDIKISFKFNDINGNVFSFPNNQIESIKFKDILIPLSFDNEIKNLKTSNESFEKTKNAILKHPNSLETLMIVEEHQTFDSFLDDHKWFRKFLLHNQPEENRLEDSIDPLSLRFAMGICPANLLLGELRLTNNVINVWIYTNHYQIVPRFFFLFRDN
ncbi:hypothetical protein SSS_05674 [Sarcoptes scabiei]|uniref:AP5B1 middle domain-containing protein n=2 Tax=Sarcoptes scabiei TaxID=52283 RepID=A0A834R5H2_SARSC|nr:hypothetical protein SSS_05674 [Sarcoptes scabiei]